MHGLSFGVWGTCRFCLHESHKALRAPTEGHLCDPTGSRLANISFSKAGPCPLPLEADLNLHSWSMCPNLWVGMRQISLGFGGTKVHLYLVGEKAAEWQDAWYSAEPGGM